MQGEAIKLKLDIAGVYPPVSYPYPDRAAIYGGERAFCERFKEDGVKYRINGTEYTSIYGLTISTRKDGEVPVFFSSSSLRAHIIDRESGLLIRLCGKKNSCI
jgi:hypothetical protein